MMAGDDLIRPIQRQAKQGHLSKVVFGSLSSTVMFCGMQLKTETTESTTHTLLNFQEQLTLVDVLSSRSAGTHILQIYLL